MTLAVSLVVIFTYREQSTRRESQPASISFRPGQVFGVRENGTLSRQE